MYTKEQLQAMTRTQLIQLARDNKIVGIQHRMKKDAIVNELHDKLEARSALQHTDQVAIQLYSNIYHPKTGRLTIGIYIVSKEVAHELTNKLSDKIVRVLTPQEVAAYYGLSNGDSA